MVCWGGRGGRRVGLGVGGVGGSSRDGEGEEGMVCLQGILLNLMLPPAMLERNPNAEMVEVWGGWEMVCKIFLVLLVSL